VLLYKEDLAYFKGKTVSLLYLLDSVKTTTNYLGTMSFKKSLLLL